MSRTRDGRGPKRRENAPSPQRQSYSAVNPTGARVPPLTVFSTHQIACGCSHEADDGASCNFGSGWWWEEA